MFRNLLTKVPLQAQRRTIFSSCQIMFQQKDWKRTKEEWKEKANDLADEMGSNLKDMKNKADEKMENLKENTKEVMGVSDSSEERGAGTKSKDINTEEWLREEESAYNLYHDHPSADAIGNAEGPIGKDPAEEFFKAKAGQRKSSEKQSSSNK
jgi:ElaB/YqjD/DUF883 family membrane-anchored ribosome-binding protein